MMPVYIKALSQYVGTGNLLKAAKRNILMKKLEAIVERNKDGFWVTVEGRGNHMPNGYGDSLKDAISNLRVMIADYNAHEGASDKFWTKINPRTVEFELKYDLTAFFEEFKFLNISTVAKAAKLNPSLLRQYATGTKKASVEQTNKIEHTIHELGKLLQSVSFKKVNTTRV